MQKTVVFRIGHAQVGVRRTRILKAGARIASRVPSHALELRIHKAPNAHLLAMGNEDEEQRGLAEHILRTWLRGRLVEAAESALDDESVFGEDAGDTFVAELFEDCIFDSLEEEHNIRVRREARERLVSDLLRPACTTIVHAGVVTREALSGTSARSLIRYDPEEDVAAICVSLVRRMAKTLARTIAPLVACECEHLVAGDVEGYSDSGSDEEDEGSEEAFFDGDVRALIRTGKARGASIKA